MQKAKGTSMSKLKCSCDQFERLEGASVKPYIATFLEFTTGTDLGEKNRLRCRACAREWDLREPATKSKGDRPSLVRRSAGT